MSCGRSTGQDDVSTIPLILGQTRQFNFKMCKHRRSPWVIWALRSTFQVTHKSHLLNSHTGESEIQVSNKNCQMLSGKNCHSRGQLVRLPISLHSSATADLTLSLSHATGWRVEVRGSESQQALTQQGIVSLQVGDYVSLLFHDVF